jgi:hypothetical protein
MESNKNSFDYLIDKNRNIVKVYNATPIHETYSMDGKGELIYIKLYAGMDENNNKVIGELVK